MRLLIVRQPIVFESYGTLTVLKITSNKIN
jgi:hypothetical protein